MEKKDYYNILGITEEEKKLTGDKFNEIVKKNFRKLSLKYHPDRQVGKSESEQKEAEQKFKEINEANSILSDPQKRQQYDLGDSFEGFNSFGGMGDMFGFASEFFGGRGRQQRERVEKADDIETVVYVTLEEVVNGATKNITYKQNVPCKECNGTGSADGKEEKCEFCHGLGYVTKTTRQGNTMFQQTGVCQHCNGTGKIIKNKCKKCNGSGYEQTTVTETINIPKGVFDGAAIKLQGKGNKAKSINGIDGDLIIVFKLKEHNLFKVEGDNLIYELKLDLDEAWCGCEKEIKTLENTVIKLKIPELTEDGKTFRLSGKGIPHIQSMRDKGDLYVIIKYKKLDKISDKQKKLIKEFYGRK